MKIVKEKTTLDLCEKGDDEITLFGGRILILKYLSRIHMLLGFPDPDLDPLTRGMDPTLDPDPFIIMQK